MLVNQNGNKAAGPAIHPTLWDGIAAVLAVFFALFLLLRPAAPAGTVCIVTWDSGEITLPLHRTETTVIESRGITLTVSVKDGGVSVTEAGCPDGVCRSTGEIRHGGEIIVCVPAGVVIRIPGETAADFVAG